jgi:N-acetylglucosaminyl-diphospho-decaprenol L-rhamnosyltransferase
MSSSIHQDPLITLPTRDPAPFGSLLELLPGCSVLVVIVNYRTARLSIECLRSLLEEKRRMPGLRAVVVDNDSSDGSAQKLASAIVEHGLSDWACCLSAPRNGGYAYGNNLAIRAALASEHAPDFFLLLNPDSQARPGAVGTLLDFFANHSRVGIAGSCLENPDGTLWSTAFRFPTLLGELEGGARLGLLTRVLKRWEVPVRMGDRAERVDWLPGASMMVRRDVFESIGLMDEEFFLYYEETDFCLRAHRAGWSCWYVPESRVMHIAGQSTGVTDRAGPPRRRPQYVFDSRYRYFRKNHGPTYAVLADLAWTLAFASWRVRRRLQGKPDPDPPALLFDSLRNSALWRLVRA